MVNNFYDFYKVFKKSITFPAVFEILIWLLYVCVYKYSYHLDSAHLPHIPDSNFPYLTLCLYSICSTVYIIFYYRWAAPELLDRKKYLWLLVVTVIYFIVIAKLNDFAVASLFVMLSKGMTEHSYFLNLQQNPALDLNIVMTDVIAFLCIALSRFSYQNELRRHKIETDHLQLQLAMLKNQLQPHFLFNTLNSLYGMSLSNSKDTSRFILLLSQMMQYILYDCDQEMVPLKDELVFLEGYFELEQKKFPDADISFKITGLNADIKIPPMLFLPLVENSFKHGKHKLENKAMVGSEVIITLKNITFLIKNDTLQPVSTTSKQKKGGIGLANINKRLALYYPGQYQLNMTEINNQYIVELKIDL
ncbi:MAG: sensor histidine kinase [Pedobacter sp.]